MPSILEDPSSRIPAPKAHTTAAPTLTPRHTALPKASGAGMTLYPITGGPSSIPWELVKFLHAEFSAEIERGSTYPMEQPMGLEQFAEYWFGTFAVVAVLDEEGGEGLRDGRDWEKVCLGTFYIKPNYPGKSDPRENDSQLIRCVHDFYLRAIRADDCRPLLSYLQCGFPDNHRRSWEGRWTADGRGLFGVCSKAGMIQSMHEINVYRY